MELRYVGILYGKILLFLYLKLPLKICKKERDLFQLLIQLSFKRTRNTKSYQQIQNSENKKVIIVKKRRKIPLFNSYWLKISIVAPPFPFSKTTLSLYPFHFVEQREETFPYSIIFEGKFAGMQTIFLKILPCNDGRYISYLTITIF